MTSNDHLAAARSTLPVGLFAHLAEHRGSVEQTYLDYLDLFEYSESVGVESAWVRQFHLARPTAGRLGGLPSPFVFLGALAARTTTLRLGTAAVTLPLEQVLRVAEDAAVLDAVSGGRVELGLANGGQPQIAEAFGIRRIDDREGSRRAYLTSVDHLIAALRGETLTPDGEVLAPARPGLADRIWHATLTEQSAFETGRRGEGVLIGTTQVVPGEVSAAAYHRGLREGAAPRVGLSTWIFPARDRDEALRLAEPGLVAKWEWAKDFLPRADSTGDIADRLNLHYGTAADIAASIAGHPAFPHTTQIQLQLDGLYRDVDQQKAALALFAGEVAPELARARRTAVAA
ncbi:LLM class flavin-dependent oxidoreductase [Microbacterium trichothecenolyticum]|uniref:LLM class flavin-dependent oxidoreductase n=1 Tax=Microbacterium ureisolvens TaxID=2781186 RepID=A0ABS7HVY9_9MICO|nr:MULTISPECIES: LLM class flavin-dependent oxidoreductase [Microbacterium]MBW9108965.1 LLM class flavin-dependent oxidoreductase [Microbacterium ureisolvens]MBW9119911.1 LLM class flavin-dependent oxidoreductase [Microbacterium trichothecenolyticum]